VGRGRRKKHNAEFAETQRALRREGGRYKGLENLREAVWPIDSVMVMVWLAGMLESLSSWPLGQWISRESAWEFWARPKVRISSLAER